MDSIYAMYLTQDKKFIIAGTVTKGKGIIIARINDNLDSIEFC